MFEFIANNKNIIDIIPTIVYIIISIFLLTRLIKSFGLKKNNDEIQKKTIAKFLDHIVETKKKNGEKVVSIDLSILTTSLNKKSKAQNDSDIEEQQPKIEFLLNIDVSEEVKKELMKQNFNENIFLSKVEDVIEMIFDSINQTSCEKIKDLVSSNLFRNFSSQIEEMKNQNRYLKSNLISILDKKIKDISIVSNKYLSLVLYVESEQINFIEDKEKNVVSGNKKNINKVREEWVFTKIISKLSNTYWLLDDIKQLPENYVYKK